MRVQFAPAASMVAASVFLVACAGQLDRQQLLQDQAVRDARCQTLKEEIDAARGNPLRRDYLLREYDRECRGVQ